MLWMRRARTLVYVLAQAASHVKYFFAKMDLKSNFVIPACIAEKAVQKKGFLSLCTSALHFPLRKAGEAGIY